MANNQGAGMPSAPSDLPPPYSAVVGNPQYGFVAPGANPGIYPGFVAPGTEPFHPPNPGAYPGSKAFTPVGVYPHPTAEGAPVHMAPTTAQPTSITVPVGIVVPPTVGSEPTTITCYNCNKVVTTRVNYTTAWHTHLVAGSVCIITMVCSLCCLGLVPYCFDTFKDAEHYCPNCNTFIGKTNKC